jgi:hypothetical protein
MKTTDALAKRGNKIIIFAPKSKEKIWKRPFKVHENIRIHWYKAYGILGYKTFKISIPNFLSTKKILEKFNPDVIHIHTPGTAGLTGLFVGKYIKKKVIMTYHTYLPDFLVCISPTTILHLTEVFEKLSISKINRKIDTFLKTKKIKDRNLFEIREKIYGSVPNPAKQMVIFASNKVHERCDIVTTPSLAMKKLLKKEKLKAPIIYLSNGIN